MEITYADYDSSNLNKDALLEDETNLNKDES